MPFENVIVVTPGHLRDIEGLQPRDPTNPSDGRDGRERMRLDVRLYGLGSKAVLPRKASAKLDFRLVKGQRPDDILSKLRRTWIS